MAEPVFAPPDSFLLSQLKAHNCEYKPELISSYDDFWEGGERFEQNKTKYLTLRQFEKSANPGANAYRTQRLGSSAYTNHLGGLISWLVSGAMQSEPTILATGPEDKIKYYNELNQNVDRTGMGFSSLARASLIEAMVHGRSYFSIDFPQDGMVYTSLGDQRKVGALDASICHMKAINVQDWDYDAYGNLMWVRTHSMTYLRSMTWGPVDTELHTWSFVTADAIHEYVATKKCGTEFKDDDKATRSVTTPHSLNALPIVPINLDKGFWIMNRLFGIAKSLFNREASADFALDTSALALPVLKSDRKDISGLVANELAVMWLGSKESFEYTVPDASHFQALAASADSKRDNLFTTVQAMSLQASQIPSAGRQSGTAKQIDASMISTLLGAYASALKESLKRTLELIRNCRGDGDVKIVIHGLDRFDVQDINALIRKTKDYQELKVSETSKRFQAKKTALQMCCDAPPAVKDVIDKESDKLDFSSESDADETQVSNSTVPVPVPDEKSVE